MDGAALSCVRPRVTDVRPSVQRLVLSGDARSGGWALRTAVQLIHPIEGNVNLNVQALRFKFTYTWVNFAPICFNRFLN